MILTSAAILQAISDGEIEVSPFRPECLGPNSLDLHLADTLRVYELPYGVIDSHAIPETIPVPVPAAGLVLRPGVLYLGSTVERTYTPRHVPKIEGRSSWGRLGLKTHITAGLGDIGFRGHWTLELEVTHPLRIYPGARICQLCFLLPHGDTAHQYRGSYLDQSGPTPSRYRSDR